MAIQFMAGRTMLRPQCITVQGHFTPGQSGAAVITLLMAHGLVVIGDSLYKEVSGRPVGGWTFSGFTRQKES